jgi:hypothetical protein
MIKPELMPVQIHFTDGTTLRCNENRCFDVEGFGRCPVDELRRGDVIIDGPKFKEWRTVFSVDLGKEKAAELLAQTQAAGNVVQEK